MGVYIVIPKRKMLRFPERVTEAGIVQPEPIVLPDKVVIPPPLELTAAVVFIIDGGGAAITTGQKGHIRLPFAGTIVSAALAADRSGSIVIDIWKDSLANFPPTNADSITASAPPTLSSAQVGLDAVLTGWTKDFAMGDFWAFNVDSCVTIQRVTLSLVVRRF